LLVPYIVEQFCNNIHISSRYTVQLLTQTTEEQGKNVYHTRLPSFSLNPSVAASLPQLRAVLSHEISVQRLPQCKISPRYGVHRVAERIYMWLCNPHWP